MNRAGSWRWSGSAHFFTLRDWTFNLFPLIFELKNPGNAVRTDELIQDLDLS
jgi:hypothetical protein